MSKLALDRNNRYGVESPRITRDNILTLRAATAMHQNSTRRVVESVIAELKWIITSMVYVLPE